MCVCLLPSERLKVWSHTLNEKQTTVQYARALASWAILRPRQNWNHSKLKYLIDYTVQRTLDYVEELNKNQNYYAISCIPMPIYVAIQKENTADETYSFIHI